MAEAFAQAFGWVTGGATGLLFIYLVIGTFIGLVTVLDKLTKRG